MAQVGSQGNAVARYYHQLMQVITSWGDEPMKNLFLLLITLNLFGCGAASIVQDKTTSYNAQSQARVRLYGQNGKMSTMWRGVDCAGGNKGEKVNVGGGIGDAMASFAGAVSSRSLGMPATRISKDIKEQNGMLSKAYFEEFAVPAGKTVIVETSILDSPGTDT